MVRYQVGEVLVVLTNIGCLWEMIMKPIDDEEVGYFRGANLGAWSTSGTAANGNTPLPPIPSFPKQGLFLPHPWQSFTLKL